MECSTGLDSLVQNLLNDSLLRTFLGHTAEKISQTSKTNIEEKEEDQSIKKQNFMAKVIIT
jgi:hypothetical protein